MPFTSQLKPTISIFVIFGVPAIGTRSPQDVVAAVYAPTDGVPLCWWAEAMGGGKSRGQSYSAARRPVIAIPHTSG